MTAGTELAETVWHERLRRRLHPDTYDAQMRLLVHELLVIAAGCPRRLDRLDEDGRCHWQAMPPERGSPEFIERETGRLLDEMGTLVGIGPRPRGSAPCFERPS